MEDTFEKIHESLDALVATIENDNKIAAYAITMVIRSKVNEIQKSIVGNGEECEGEDNEG